LRQLGFLVKQVHRKFCNLLKLKQASRTKFWSRRNLCKRKTTCDDGQCCYHGDPVEMRCVRRHSVTVSVSSVPVQHWRIEFVSTYISSFAEPRTAGRAVSVCAGTDSKVNKVPLSTYASRPKSVCAVCAGRHTNTSASKRAMSTDSKSI